MLWPSGARGPSRRSVSQLRGQSRLERARRVEVLLDDAREQATRAKAAGVDVALEVWDTMVHVWHWVLPMLDEAQAAIDRIGAFVRERAR